MFDKNHIAVHLLQLRVLVVQLSPFFDPAFTRSFPVSAIKKCLIFKKLIFLHSIFFSENIVIHYYHLVPNTLDIQSWTRFTFLQSQNSKRSLNVITHKHSKNTTPLIYSALILNQNTALLLVSYDLLNLNLLFHLLSGSYTSTKITLVIKECKLSPLVVIKIGSFNQCFERFWIAGGITHIMCFVILSYPVAKLAESHNTSCMIVLRTLISKIIDKTLLCLHWSIVRTILWHRIQVR